MIEDMQSWREVDEERLSSGKVMGHVILKGYKGQLTKGRGSKVE